MIRLVVVLIATITLGGCAARSQETGTTTAGVIPTVGSSATSNAASTSTRGMSALKIICPGLPTEGLPAPSVSLTAARPSATCRAVRRGYHGIFRVTQAGCAGVLTTSTSGTRGPKIALHFKATFNASASASECVALVTVWTNEEIEGFSVALSPSGVLFGVPTFSPAGANESGDCSTALAFTAAKQTATIQLYDATIQYPTFTVSGTVPAIATATVSGSTLTVTAVAAGTTAVTVTDQQGNAATCNIGVTTSTGTVS